jgi:CBS domain-containing protein
MTEPSEWSVASRVPSLVDQRLSVISRREPLTVPPGTPLRECLSLIRRSGMGDSVFVTDREGRLLGVLTERDIFAQLVGTDADLSAPVEERMNRQPRTLRLEETVRQAMALMQTGRYRNIPIIDDEGRLVGVVRPVDVLRFLAEAFPEELLNLPPRPHQAAQASEGA